MILYGHGEPMEALRQLGPFEAFTAKTAPGVTSRRDLGQRSATGEGDVNIKSYLQTLKEIGYVGPLTIEREIPQDPERQLREIEQAVRLLERLREEVLER